MSAISRRMNVITRCSNQYRVDRLNNGELAARHHSFVLAICNHQGCSQEQLAKILCFNKSTVARSLNQLQEHGYITRISDENDKRVLLVYPTEKMLAVFPKVRRITREWNESLALGIEHEEMEVFLNVLSRMEARAKELIGNGEGSDL